MSRDLIDELADVGAILIDHHFVYVSGRHGPNYINLDPVFPNVALTYSICERLQEPFAAEFETVASPAVGGVVLCVLTALAAAKQTPVAAVWADKNRDGFEFERAGFVDHLKGKRVLLVEDLLTTGGSLAAVRERVIAHGGDVIGASVICNRGGVSAEALGVPKLVALSTVDFEAFDAEDCPLCRAQVPIVEDIGHGAEYRAAHPTYTGGFMRLLS